jgi:hypothetical protein
VQNDSFTEEQFKKTFDTKTNDIDSKNHYSQIVLAITWVHVFLSETGLRSM